VVRRVPIEFTIHKYARPEGETARYRKGLGEALKGSIAIGEGRISQW